MSARERYEASLRRMTFAVERAYLAVERMPNRTPAERVARANAMVAALRIPKMGEWRPVFPFDSLLMATGWRLLA